MTSETTQDIQNKLDVIPIVARDLLGKYGLTSQGWTFAWMDKQRRTGECSHREKQIRYSINYLTSPAAVIGNTLLHEIAHALAGPGHHHDDHWRSIARSIGCSGDRCTAGHFDNIEYRYTIRCVRCNTPPIKRNRLPHNIDEYRCKRCKKHITVHDNHAER